MTCRFSIASSAADLYGAIAAAIVAHGDQFEMNYETHLTMAHLAK
jgi:hypothetical protein